MSAHPQLVELKCRNCGSQLDPEDISAELAAARCRHCDALFAIPTKIREERDEIPRPKVGLPKNFELSQQGPDLVITRERPCTVSGIGGSLPPLNRYPE